jgi:hypothetical protein
LSNLKWAHLGDIGTGGKIILEWSLRRYIVEVFRICLTLDRVYWLFPGNMIINLEFQKMFESS